MRPARLSALVRSVLRGALAVSVAAAALLAGAAPAAAAPSGPGLSAPWKGALTGAWSRPVPRLLAPVPAPVVAPAPVVDPLTSYADRVLALVNAERAAAGLPALRRSSCATGFAVTWSRRMASTGDFAHQSLTPLMRDCAARGAGENIAYGASTPERVMQMWMASPGHRANILRSSYTHLGVGAATSSTGVVYVTQDFLTL